MIALKCYSYCAAVLTGRNMSLARPFVCPSVRLFIRLSRTSS